MFLQILVTLAVCVAFLSASSVQHADSHGTILDFDNLNVPVNNELGRRLMKSAKEDHHLKTMADRSEVSLAKAAVIANSPKDHRVKKELTTASVGSAGYLTTFKNLNSDCSGTPSSASYTLAAGYCMNTEDPEINKIFLCTADGNEIVQTFTAGDCAPESIIDEQVHAQAVPCEMDVSAFQNDGKFQMTSTRCIAGTNPTFGAGVRTTHYQPNDCSGDMLSITNQLFNVCTFHRNNDGSFYYTKMLGCTADGSGYKLVEFSDRNCFHPVAKSTVALAAGSTTCAGFGDGSSEITTCNMPPTP